MTRGGYVIKLSPEAMRFFRNDEVPPPVRIELLKKCKSLMHNPYPKTSRRYIVKNETIFRIVDEGARICYTVEKNVVTILVVLVRV